MKSYDVGLHVRHEISVQHTRIEHDFQMYLADGHFLLIMICSELKFLLLVH
jgi:hypothetical protein